MSEEQARAIVEMLTQEEKIALSEFLRALEARR